MNVFIVVMAIIIVFVMIVIAINVFHVTDEYQIVFICLDH